ncbi:MAG: Mur ligase domain-containing protein, partial [Chitinophagales bacterium]|nr:Mur ligase domain-containing protein [Chitinophagales bacterium]
MTATTPLEALYKVYLQCRNVSTDTRNIGEGDFFFALKGPTFNGNLYAADALKKGAIAAVIDEEQYKTNERYLLMPNVLEA